MIPKPSQTVLSMTARNKGPERQSLDLGHLNFLGRMPIPLRRPFKIGLDRTVATYQAATGIKLDYCFLSGSEWYRPFDELVAAGTSADLPDMLVTTLHHDILDPGLLVRYTPQGGEAPPIAAHPACVEGGLLDPLGVFQTFAVVPFVFLVDHQRLKGRAAPSCWSDMLDPIWSEDIVFGGWRPHNRTTYQDYNSYLLFSLYQEFGQAGLEAFAANVRTIQHNIRTATQVGSNSRKVGAIAILPWLQAELCPRRGRTRVIWPEDGALAMPIGYLIKPEARSRLAPLVNYVCGAELGVLLARNCYPPVNAAVADAFPAAARLKWAGWDYLRNHDLAAEELKASQLFFSAWNRVQEKSVCS